MARGSCFIFVLNIAWNYWNLFDRLKIVFMIHFLVWHHFKHRVHLQLKFKLVSVVCVSFVWKVLHFLVWLCQIIAQCKLKCVKLKGIKPARVYCNLTISLWKLIISVFPLGIVKMKCCLKVYQFCFQFETYHSKCSNLLTLNGKHLKQGGHQKCILKFPVFPGFLPIFPISGNSFLRENLS